MKFSLHLSMLFLILVSCNSSKEAMEKPQKEQNILSGEYLITTVGPNNYSAYNLSITFDDKSKQMTGFAGCNRFFGGYTLANNTLTFGAIAASKKYCQKEINNVERDLLLTLNRVNSFFIKDDVIQLKENNTIILTATMSQVNKKSDTTNNAHRTVVIYEINSKDSYEYLSVSKANISISEDKELQNISNYTYNEKDWVILNTHIENVNLDTFNKLKSPSDNPITEAATQATLAIQIGDTQYMTSKFEHGNPPKEIEALVNKVLSIKENIVKQ